MKNDKARRFRERLAGRDPVVIVGAHNGLSAKLVEAAGFDGVWASGFEISAAHGVPDANILTMAECLSAAREINDAIDIPVIADCDNGFGNAVNVIRTVREYEAAGIAGICIEDNVFPKRCSFYAGVRRELVPALEHAGKVMAAREAATSRDFVVIARTEALIAGWGMDEALRRGHAYADAGADLVLIHSKAPTPAEVMEFARRWERDTPIIVVPTIYKGTTVDELAAAGIKAVIFANHALRSSLKAMRESLAILKREGKAGAIDDRIAPLKEVYELIGVPELEAQESRYLPRTDGATTAIVIAAGSSAVSGSQPRAMLEVRGRTVLSRQVGALNVAGIRQIAVVRGHGADAVDVGGVRFYENQAWAETGEVASLFAAEDEMRGRFLALYGDVLFEPWVVERLLRSPDDITIVVDRSSIDGLPAEARAERDLVVATRLPDVVERLLHPTERPRVRAMGRAVPADRGQAEFIGMAMFSGKGAALAREAFTRYAERLAYPPFQGRSSFALATLPDFLQELIEEGTEVACVEVRGGWLEIDTFADYQRAWAEVRG